MNWFMRLIRRLFLIKEIISRAGVVHFQRYRLLSTPWFALYLHKICQSDMDADPHDHPWNYSSLILSGAYRERYVLAPNFDKGGTRSCFAGDVIKHQAEDVHQLTLLSKTVWTLVLTSGRLREWGYRLHDGSWIHHKEYRTRKNTKYGVKVTFYDAKLFENWVLVDGQRFETNDYEKAREFAWKCESNVTNYRGLYSVHKIED